MSNKFFVWFMVSMVVIAYAAWWIGGEVGRYAAETLLHNDVPLEYTAGANDPLDHLPVGALKVTTDTLTGCQYLTLGSSNTLIPRLTATGDHVGCEFNPDEYLDPALIDERLFPDPDGET